MTTTQLYLWLTSIFSVWAFNALGPTRASMESSRLQGPNEHLITSFILGIALGWLAWPILLLALLERSGSHEG